MTDPVLLVEVSERIATVTMNRPDARNALSSELRAALYRAARDLDADDAVDVVILTGADPAFCAGLDLKELGRDASGLGAGSGDAGSRDETPPVLGNRPPMGNLTKPVIGAINGVAITGGLEVALGCDLLIASERARFADTHARVGIQPGWGLTVFLPEAVGLRRAREMSTTGNFVDASTALAWGLVNHVVPHEELLPVCRQLAADIVSNDQRAVRTILGTYRAGALVTGGDAWELEARTAKDWTAGGVDAAQIEKRRQAVVDRGRRQV
jgi:enoyl-CoA hydratase